MTASGVGELRYQRWASASGDDSVGLCSDDGIWLPTPHVTASEVKSPVNTEREAEM